MNHVLLIDDDIELVGMFPNTWSRKASGGLRPRRRSRRARSPERPYAIAVLDVMMPRMNGIETLRRIRAGSHMPVLMLTGRGDDADRILGLELGADDYVTKPCTPRELTARVRAILRRTHGTAARRPCRHHAQRRQAEHAARSSAAPPGTARRWN